MCHKPADLAYGFGSSIRIDENGSKPAYPIVIESF
jgi:hypothetical protein